VGRLERTRNSVGEGQRFLEGSAKKRESHREEKFPRERILKIRGRRPQSEGLSKNYYKKENTLLLLKMGASHKGMYSGFTKSSVGTVWELSRTDASLAGIRRKSHGVAYWLLGGGFHRINTHKLKVEGILRGWSREG